MGIYIPNLATSSQHKNAKIPLRKEFAAYFFTSAKVETFFLGAPSVSSLNMFDIYIYIKID